jgi:hypothetical protein
MSSALRQISQPVRLATVFHRVETPCYYDNDVNRNLLFPFSYTNGTLDIQYIDNFKTDMVDISGNSPNTDADASIQIIGGKHLVQHIGENFKAYIRAWRASTIDAESPIEVYINGVVQKAQYCYENHIGDSSYTISTVPPAGDNYTEGDAANHYRTTWIFNRPLTITTIEGGIKNYITFTTRLDED